VLPIIFIIKVCNVFLAVLNVFLKMLSLLHVTHVILPVSLVQDQTPISVFLVKILSISSGILQILRDFAYRPVRKVMPQTFSTSVNSVFRNAVSVGTLQSLIVEVVTVGFIFSRSNVELYVLMGSMPI
jgi:hypothetical protein